MRYHRQRFHDYLECENVGMAVVKFKNGAIGTIEGTTNVIIKTEGAQKHTPLSDPASLTDLPGSGRG